MTADEGRQLFKSILTHSGIGIGLFHIPISESGVSVEFGIGRTLAEREWNL